MMIARHLNTRWSLADIRDITYFMDAGRGPAQIAKIMGASITEILDLAHENADHFPQAWVKEWLK
jgi:hypothetical protein